LLNLIELRQQIALFRLEMTVKFGMVWGMVQVHAWSGSAWTSLSNTLRRSFTCWPASAVRLGV